MKKKRVFLTGAGGTMGNAALKELLKSERSTEHDIVILDLPSERSRKRLKPFENTAGLEIVWGDLTNYNDVLKCVSGADYVLHGAALISPAADHNPELAWKVNLGSIENILKAIKSQPDPNAVKLVTIGTVAATGDRLPPIHVGRIGDPLKPSIFDMYACSKIAAERLVAESGLKHWVSLRQTYITYPDMVLEPIMFHQPLNTCLEICTEYNAGLVFANVLADDIPEDFWRRFYNIGGGPSARITYIDLLKKVFAQSGKDYREIFDRNWFTLRNFHCHWYEDSHVLNQYLRHQVEGIDEYLETQEKSMSVIQKIAARLTSAAVMKNRVFAPLAREHVDSPLSWAENNMDMRITAFYKSREALENIPDWDINMPEKPSRFNYTRLDHGYDESKPSEGLDLEDMQSAAEFRGGTCLSQQMAAGDLYTRLSWQCAFEHKFEASPNLVLKGGHWCPECAPPGWNFDEESKRNPFLAQVWYPNHDHDEHNFYPEDCWKDILTN